MSLQRRLNSDDDHNFSMIGKASSL